MANPELKEAVWRVLDQFARRPDSGGSLHSDLVIRKFPQVNELELINVIGELVEDGRITVKAATVDAQGQPTAYHIRVRGVEDATPTSPPSGGVSETGVGFATRPGDVSPGPRPPEQKRPDEGKPIERAGRVDVGFAAPAPVKKDVAAPDSDRPKPVTIGPSAETIAAHQEEAEQMFADEAASFFAEFLAADASDDQSKKELMDQLTVLVALFQSADRASFTTPINKLAGLKAKVQRIAPELIPDFILLMQTGLRAWLGRV